MLLVLFSSASNLGSCCSFYQFDKLLLPKLPFNAFGQREKKKKKKSPWSAGEKINHLCLSLFTGRAQQCGKI